MALTALETAERRLPCHAEQADAGGKVVAAAAAEQAVPLQEADHGGRLERDDIWNMIQSQKPAAPALTPKQAPYVPAPVRRSSSLLTQKSLEICTESLGSETGSDGFSDAADRSCPGSDDDDGEGGADGVAARAMPPRAFPPPLPSLARRTVGSLQMRQHRRDGRLVVEAVPVLSNTLFRAQRRGGRLLLSFADTAAPAEDEGKNRAQEADQQQADEQTREEEEEDDGEEEVQVVDRGTVVEVKVSTQPQAHNSGARVHRSSLVINKFVGAEPVNASEINDTAAAPQQSPKPPSSSEAAAPALSATATLPGPEDDGSAATPCEGKVLMTTRRRRSKQELLNHMRRCGQLSGQLFIWEPRVATSS
ncbi:hypothetical protein CFC21_051684 [Triticum aestivum]|uniref:FAF domain-containing protein n=3 Tax=Triticum TaxID=4564 RepID=A0A9R0VWZ3_TRITD|nr:uncharacterized protein LOC119285178 [Triticum dicoccoides]XP_044362909.1 uncharacterized protein LOC123085349 [Triticum aestivum]KAF7041974.1 hypothetical protein CFC21_051684 [Triticum aestivum]VAH89030.1 unnamed protein product [Triticum turgidum subsp. durum]